MTPPAEHANTAKTVRVPSLWEGKPDVIVEVPDMTDQANTPAWQQSTAWQAYRRANYTASGPELDDAGMVAVAADRAHREARIARIRTGQTTIHDYRAAVLAVLRDTP